MFFTDLIVEFYRVSSKDLNMDSKENFEGFNRGNLRNIFEWLKLGMLECNSMRLSALI